jgi:hypothetical protein
MLFLLAECELDGLVTFFLSDSLEVSLRIGTLSFFSSFSTTTESDIRVLASISFMLIF